MYDNIGGKIKSLAVVTCIVEVIGSIIAGIALGAEEDELYFLLCLIGPIVAWVSSWILYAFGEMVEDIHVMRKKYYPMAEEQAKREAEEKAEQKTTISPNQEVKENVVVPVQIKNGKYECPKCGCSVKKGQEKCLCFSVLDWSEL